MIEPHEGQVIIYRDGALKLQVRLDAQTVWLTQAGMAELFQTSPQNITIHIKSIYADREQDETATCKDYLQVRTRDASSMTRPVWWTSRSRITTTGWRSTSSRLLKASTAAEQTSSSFSTVCLWLSSNSRIRPMRMLLSGRRSTNSRPTSNKSNRYSPSMNCWLFLTGWRLVSGQ